MTDVLLEGLLFQQPGKESLSESKKGVPTYNGSSSGYSDFSFRVLTEYSSFDLIKDDDDRAKEKRMYGAKLVKGLTDEALRIAMDLRTETTLAEDGVKVLLASLEKNLHSDKQNEASKLFQMGSKLRGPTGIRK